MGRYTPGVQKMARTEIKLSICTIQWLDYQIGNSIYSTVQGLDSIFPIVHWWDNTVFNCLMDGQFMSNCPIIGHCCVQLSNGRRVQWMPKCPTGSFDV